MEDRHSLCLHQSDVSRFVRTRCHVFFLSDYFMSVLFHDPFPLNSRYIYPQIPEVSLLHHNTDVRNQYCGTKKNTTIEMESAESKHGVKAMYYNCVYKKCHE